MARIFFMALMALHGLIHLMGFVKAYQLADIEALTQPISRPAGVLWLLAALLFLAAVIQYALQHDSWWITALVAVIISQALVIAFWQDARFGTIPNVIILAVVVVAAAGFSFDRTVSREVEAMFSKGMEAQPVSITSGMLDGLPAPVERWLASSGLVGRERITTVRLRQRAQMRMRPDVEDWTPARAVQYFTTDKPAFVWKVNMQMMPLVDVVGRDKFMEGRGEMVIKVLALFPVVDSRSNERIDTGTLQRYLGEIVWFPSAALSPYITWEEIDEYTARATMSYRGRTDSGVFHFNDQGDIEQYSAMRYMEDVEGAERKEWIIAVQETGVMNGIRIPTKMEATWKLEEGDWTWLELEIVDIEYNTPEEYRRHEMGG